MASVILALQGNPRDDATVDHEAAELARRTGRSLVAVRAVPLSDTRVPRDLGPLSYLGPHRLLPTGGDARLELAATAAREAGVEVETMLVATDDPARAIAEAARRHDAAIVLVEPPDDSRLSRARGYRLARRIRRLASAPVMTVGGRLPEEVR
jgi:nucleotide-binding universal stress UspA family protein